MSEQNWREFLEADDLDDWVVLHGGPSAVFVTDNLPAAAELARAVAEVLALEGSNIQLAIVANRLTVRLTRETWKIEPHHIGIARCGLGTASVSRSSGCNCGEAGCHRLEVLASCARIRRDAR